MQEQVSYYNDFGKRFGESILACDEPQYWTTDYDTKGRVYTEIKKRVDQQEQFIEKYFRKDLPVLDIGCGFGRQAFLLARKGFLVTGIDTSSVFIEIAKQLFGKHNLEGNFHVVDLLQENPGKTYSQVLLLDVVEHLPPAKRKYFFQKLASLTNKDGRIIISLPKVKKRLSSLINNSVRKSITQHFNFFRNSEEHPYPIPVKKDMESLIKGLFLPIEYLPANETDYYILKR